MKTVCENCNKLIEMKAAFCPNCGVKLNKPKKNIEKKSASEDVKKTEVSLETIISNAIKIPGVKVNRREFLSKTFANEDVTIDHVLSLGPVAAGCSEKMLRRIANRIVLTRTSETSIVSFAAGIPGGLAMVATIPADTLQFFGMMLRLAQELTYLYGLEDLWKNDEVDLEKVQGQLILYCGVMFGVSGASQGVRLLATQLAKQTLKKLPKKALMNTVWYPIVKQIGKAIGVKITKDVTAKGISKAIPVIGGLISGGMTFASMNPMGKRLVDVLEEANFHYTEEKAETDYNVVMEIANADKDIVLEVDALSPDSERIVDEDCEEAPINIETVERNNDDENLFETLEKLFALKEKGVISEEDYAKKKNEILSRI